MKTINPMHSPFNINLKETNDTMKKISVGIYNSAAINGIGILKLNIMIVQGGINEMFNIIIIVINMEMDVNDGVNMYFNVFLE
ncbi:TPA: hypothetical protein L1I71_002823 [Escherichia albertii]|nr:hypothetical protein [Escherichia albertii]